MASAFAQGFVQGFAGKLSERIDQRRDDAREYYNKQLEMARTTGLKNRQRVRDAVQGNISIARQLEAAGVPKEIIMAQVNSNPNGLGDFAKSVERIRADAASNGKSLTPEAWNGIFQVSGTFSAPDEDLSTFITKTYDPISTAVNTEGFADDPEGTLWSSMMGYNAMDKARHRLGTEVVADGLTAEQLLQYGDGYTPSKIGGDAVVTVNYDNLVDVTGDDNLQLTFTEQNTISKEIESIFGEVSTSAGVGLESMDDVDYMDVARRTYEEVKLRFPGIAIPDSLIVAGINAQLSRKNTGIMFSVEDDGKEVVPTTDEPEEIPIVQDEPVVEEPPVDSPVVTTSDLTAEEQKRHAYIVQGDMVLRFYDAHPEMEGYSLYEDPKTNKIYTVPNAEARQQGRERL